MDQRACARPIRALLDGPDAFVEALRAPGVDRGAFERYVDTQRLLPWVAPAVLEGPARALFGDATLESWAHRWDEHLARTDRLRAESVEIVDALAHEGIETLYLKGLSFGSRFYPELRRRWQRDVDLLVHEADVERTFATLERLGFVRDPGRIGDGVVRWGLKRGDSPVDVHWNLRRRVRRRLPEDELWREPGSFTLDDRRYATLSDENTLLFQLIAMCGDLRRGGCRARHLLDLYLMLRAFAPALDPERFLERRESQFLVGPCVNVLAVLLAVWEAAPEFPALASALERRRARVHLRGADEAAALLDRPRDHPASSAWYRRAYPYSPKAEWTRRLTRDLPYTLARLTGARTIRFETGR